METQTKILTPYTYDVVRNAARPEKTDSYQPVTHAELIDYVREQVDKMGLKVINERYSTNKEGRQMFAEMAIGSTDSELNWALGFRNSHDKSLPVGFVAGAQVMVCSNLMLSGEVKQVRRHTTNILQDLDAKFELVKENLETNFNNIKREVDLYKAEPLQMPKAAELFGKILITDERIAKVEQVIKAVELYKNPIHDFGNETVWGFVNSFTEVLKDSHPKRAASNYLNLSKFINSEFNFN